ncbi:MAG: hypothetical protein AAGC58_02225 [Asticcacaulis sp.]
MGQFSVEIMPPTGSLLGGNQQPHAFRHIAATSIATYAPEHVGIIRDILGHTTLQMAERHYNRASAVDVSIKLQRVLRELRQEDAGGGRNKRRLKRPHRHKG